MAQELPCEVHNAILYGLQKLAVLRLAFAPNDRQLPDTAIVWLEIAARKGGWIPADAARVDSAFARLAVELDKWPTPRQFFAYLPPRPVLPPPDSVLTAADRAANERMWAALAQQLGRPSSKHPPQPIRKVKVRGFTSASELLQEWQEWQQENENGKKHDEDKKHRHQSR